MAALKSTLSLEKDIRVVCTDGATGSVVELDVPPNLERLMAAGMFASSVGGCMTATVAIKARQMGINLEGTKIEVEEISGVEPRKVTRISLNFRFPNWLELDEKQEAILERTGRTCPLARSINPDIDLDVTFDWPTRRPG